MKKAFSMNSFVVGFMLGSVVIAAWFIGIDTPVSLLLPRTEISAPTQKTVPESGAISVVNQGAGTEVTVESVTVPPPGVWIAVREVFGEDLGNVLGAVRVTGPESNLTIPLLRSTVPDLTYAVQLYRDNGDDTFDVSSDSVYVDFGTGAPVIERFTTSK